MSRAILTKISTGFDWLYSTVNVANGKVALMVETQGIESTYTEEFDENQTEEKIITPSDGNKLVIKDVGIHTKATSGTVSLDLGDKKVARLYSSANNRFQPTVSSIEGDVDESLELTTTTGSNEVFIIVNYIEVEG